MKAVKLATAVLSLTLCAAGASRLAQADVITDWNDKACAMVGKVGPGSSGHRMMAIVQVSVYEAVNSIDARYTPNRNSSVVGTELGMKVGALVAEKFGRPAY